MFSRRHPDYDGVSSQQEAFDFLDKVFQLLEEEDAATVAASKQASYVVKDLFGGQKYTQLDCACGDKRNAAYDSAYSLQLNMDSKCRTTTVPSCLNRAFASVEVEEFPCESCKKKRTISKKDCIKTWGDYLILHLNRAETPDPKGGAKFIKTKIEIPTELSLDDVMLDGQSTATKPEEGKMKPPAAVNYEPIAFIERRGDEFDLLTWRFKPHFPTALQSRKIEQLHPYSTIAAVPSTSWMDVMLDGLNNAQLAAVTSPADVVQILAPPGSGKTKTLTSRVAYLIKHHNYKPWNILCLTFTIKSSREMKERLAKLIGNGMEAKLVLGTFHSVCRRYLVSYGHLIGIPKDFGIADSSDSLSIIKRILKRLRFSLDPRVAQSRISSYKSKGINVAKLSDDALKKKVDQQEFAQVFESYEDQLDQGNLLDYDDLLLRCCDLLRQHPLCVSNVEAVLIDEFQDTNVVQFDLMRLFAVQRKRITTVGDPDQSIYGWRSAEIKNLARMQTQYPETLVIHLQDNYRSSGAILLAAQELIQQDESRPSKSLLPTHCPGTLPVLRRLPSSDAEASWIVTEIIRMIGMTDGMLKHPDIAILLRSAALSRQIESAMGKAGIPYRMVGGQRFFDRVEIKVLLDYMRVVSQPTNNDAVARVVNIPARGVGTTTIKALLEEAETKKVTLWSLILDAVRGNIRTSTKINKPAEQGLGTFVQIILTAKQKLKDQVNPLSPHSLLRYIIKRLNFQDYIKRTYDIDSDGRWANVEELISQAGEFLIPSNSNLENLEAINDTSLPAIEGIAQSDGEVGEKMLSTFLANVALATELQKDEGEEDGQGQAQVTISTIHAAKGLEWPVVFVPAAYEGSIPHSRAEDTDEERRLLYVAMTRAQALLYISCPTKNSRGEESTLSQFLNPKTLGHYLINVGPQIHTEFVNDVARILKRPCPSESKMLEESLTLKSREDDLWPLDGQETLGQTKSKWESKTNAYQQNNLLPQCGHITAGKTINWDSISNITISRSLSTAGNATTMDNASSFTIHQLGGF
ncbi:MAG: hypothetical protein Q9192_007088, partial [Flavoplaca navasiana]